jgi:short-chain fatty acids transporter
LSETIGLPFNLLLVVVIMVVLALLAVALHPPKEQRYLLEEGAADQLIAQPKIVKPKNPTPAERVEHSPVLNLLIALAGLAWLGSHFLGHYREGKLGLALDLNVVNFLFLILGVLLHWTPASLSQAAIDASKPLHGIVLQFPLYAGMFGIIDGTPLKGKLAEVFVSIASQKSYPLVVFLYSAVLNYFVPSGGSKWAIEAPYLLEAAQNLHVSVNHVALAYAYGDMSTNLIQPFWAIPLLAVTRLEFKHIMGFEIVVCAVYMALVSVAILVGM